MKKRNIILGVLVAGLSFTSIFAAVTKSGKGITMEQAKAIAKSKVPGGMITSIELDYELSRAVYEIEIHLNEYEYDLKLDAATGKGISLRKEYDKDYNRPTEINTKNLTQNSTADYAQVSIRQTEAEAIALEQVPGATIQKIELDREHGQMVYEVELRKDYVEYDVEINAATGAVIKCKIDN